MLATTWHILLVAALGTSYVAISRRVDERLGGGIAVFLWGLVAIGAFELVHIETDSSGAITEYAVEQPSVGVFAASMALVMLIFTFAAATQKLPSRDETRFARST